MKVLYARCSTIEQRTDRQRVQEKEYAKVIEDYCSGATPFMDREGGKQIIKLLERGALKEIGTWSIDRMGRDVRDILNTIHYFTERGVCIHFISQSLRTVDDDGKENPIAKMMISILGVVAEMERNQIRERQREGIAIAKLRGAYLGRKKGANEDVLKFLSKPKNKLALTYLKKGYKSCEAAKLAGVHINTITKIKKLGLNTAAFDKKVSTSFR